MEFFDRKEEVLDVQLTQYGKYLLSIGKLNPSYYAFFDSDIDYDTQYQGDPPAPGNTPGPSENQKDTEDRLKETPRIKIIHSLDTVEKTSTQIQVPIQIEKKIPNSLLDQEAGAPPYETIVETVMETQEIDINLMTYESYNEFLSETYGDIPYKYVPPEKQNILGLELPLGTSDYNSKYYPAFDLTLGKGKIKSSIYYDDHKFGIFRIPQIEVEVTFETSVGEAGDKNEFSIKDVVSIKDSTEPAEYNYTKVSEDGTYIKVEEDYIYINLRELNSIEGKQNFTIEVYEVENPDTDSEILHPLKFSGEYLNDLYADYLYDKTNNSLQVSDKFVEYFFKVTVDDEIQSAPEPGKISVPLPNNDFDVCED